MKLYSIRGGNESDLKTKKYNIGVGISLGNKWFTPENITEAVKWSLQYTRETVIIYVADSTHAINIEVRNRVSLEKASLRAKILGDQLFEKVKEEVNKKLSLQEIEKLVYVKWDQIIDDFFRKKLAYLTLFYKTNKEFKEAVHSIVKDHVSKESRSFSDLEIDRFGQYIVEELPEILTRVKMGGSTCDAYAYPYDGELPKFIERLQKGNIFPEIKERVMDTEPKVFLEVR